MYVGPEFKPQYQKNPKISRIGLWLFPLPGFVLHSVGKWAAITKLTLSCQGRRELTQHQTYYPPSCLVRRIKSSISSLIKRTLLRTSPFTVFPKHVASMHSPEVAAVEGEALWNLNYLGAALTYA
jgi:hypothetical protein